jgi:predicted dehydrogenase
MGNLRVGIVGSGFGGTVHAPAYALHPRFDVVAIASPSSAERVAKERKIPHAFGSVEDMLAGVELDVVSVASPPFDHHRSVLAALAAGKHVLCEKPFALNVAEAEEMSAAGERAGTATALAFEFRYVPGVIAVKELIDNGHVGALREIEVARLGRELLERNTKPRPTWWFSRAAGGGIANAFMPHFFDLATHLAGRKPRATLGCMRTANPHRMGPDAKPFDTDVADGAFAFVDYGDGLIARCSGDMTVIVESTTVAVHGERRSVIGNGTSFGDFAVFAIAEDEQDELEIAPSPYAKHAAIHGNLPFFLPLLDAFAERIDLGTPGVPTFADGLLVQQQLEAIGYGTVSAGNSREARGPSAQP